MPDSVTEVLPAEQTQALALSMHDFEISLENARLLAQMMREHMKEGVHYGRFQRDGKPSLWDPGASLICSAFGVHPQYRVLEHREDDETGHFRYVIEVTLVHHATGRAVAAGVGAASTREVKYAFRWVPEDEVPPWLDIDNLRSRLVKDNILYRVPNPEVQDLDNTILKIAAKRAEVDATLKLPGCSELFTQDIGVKGSLDRRDSPRAAGNVVQRLPDDLKNKGQLMAAVWDKWRMNKDQLCRLLEIDSFDDLPNTPESVQDAWRRVEVYRSGQSE